MGKINPNDIVEKVKIPLDEGWGYIWGKAGETWTAADQKAVESDPNGREQTKKYGEKWVGHKVADCSGLIKWVFKQLGMSLPHGSNSQYMKYCDTKGKIEKDTILLPGCGVFKYDASLSNPYYHVGIYIGDGKVIEAQGTYKGVVKTGLFGWSHYGYWKNVDWGKGKMDDLKKGSNSGSVAVLQAKLNALGFDCGKIDGIFGEKTEKAVKAFQTSVGLRADGVVGDATWDALNAATVPQMPTTPTDIPLPPTTMTITADQYAALCQARDILVNVLGNG